MKIVSVTFVRNEADVIETFVRHHAQIVDSMIIVDHMSMDDTPLILENLKSEGVPIHIVNETRQEFAQAEMTTFQMKRAVNELGADWVIFLDADEFLVPDKGRNIGMLFEKLSQEHVHNVFWRTYVPRPEDPLNERFLFNRIQYCRAEEPNPVSKVLVPRIIAAKKTTVLRTGNHKIRDMSRFRKKNIQAKHAEHLHIAHFPVRSVEQITAKVLLGWPSRLASPEQKGSKNYHIRKIFRKVQKCSEISAEDLMTLALDYAMPEHMKDIPQKLVRDPVVSPCGQFTLKYPNNYSLNLVSALAELAEDLAIKLGEERKRTDWKRIFSRG